ncbi:DUF4402 domain-containing protein [Massilia sp. CCM 9210]|uniref:DUF4402 domain-containing protein n=1 Tax=Massilia scottii TaxID=3057166 RepID=UPI00279686FE|nr:DUF4402 domain-containing protein [Massilia sp. CCM 9210]MDQ1813000.1 DUF4402 domain-containing protein [Massilia sp. CCM 9210]
MNTTDARARWRRLLRRSGTLGVAACLLAATPGRAQLNAVAAGDLAFGRFAAISTGFVSVGTSGARSSGGGVVLLASAGAPARFTISDKTPANASLVYIVSLPASASISDGASSMVLTDFVSSPAGAGVLSGGTQVLAVGATLQVAAGQRPGNYSGAFHITIEYQ